MANNVTNYLVEQNERMKSVEKYSGTNALEAYVNAAKTATVLNIPLIIVESEFSGGRFLGEIKFAMNPPCWSGHSIPPRGTETCIKHVTGHIDCKKSEILRLQEEMREYGIGHLIDRLAAETGQKSE